MVGKIDRLLAIDILNKCFRGLTYDAFLRRHFVNIPNVNQRTLQSLADKAAARGIHLYGRDLNHFLENLTDLNHSMNTRYEFYLADKEILTGEVFRVYLNKMDTYAELIKAKAQDYIIARTKGNNFPKTHYLHVKPGFQWRPGELLPFSQENNHQIIKEIEYLTPCIEHRYVDWWLDSNIAEYEVTNNLWPLYNKTHEIMDDNKMNNSFFSITREYLYQGLSVFTLYKVILSIEYFWYGADV